MKNSTFLVKSLAIFSILFLTTTRTFASERITNFKVDINVKTNGITEVTENITFKVENFNIKHGIYRDIPTIYGSTSKYLDVLEVQRDGKDENYELSSIDNGKRIKIGNAKVIIPNGSHTYKIRYTMEDSIGFFEDHDELYWNVTGDEWKFPIDKADVTVNLPKGISANSIKTKGFVGPYGSTELNNLFNVSDSKVYGYTKRNLGLQEGYTIVVGFPKGVITQPTPEVVKPRELLNPKYKTGFFLILFLIVLGISTNYYLKVKREPNYRTPLTVRFEPPENSFPSFLGFFNSGGISYDSKMLSTEILNLAINGYLKIKENSNKSYSLIKQNKNIDDLNEVQKAIYNKIFSEADVFDMDSGIKIYFSEQANRNKIILQSISAALAINLGTLRRKLYIKDSKMYLIYLGIYTAFTIIGYFIVSGMHQSVDDYFSQVIIVLFSFGFISLLISGLQTDFLLGLFIMIFFSLGLLIWGSYVVDNLGGLNTCFLLLSIFTMNLTSRLFTRLNKEGQIMQNQLEGFKEFLSSQKNYIEGVEMSLPEKFNMYEKFLPYAIALGVEPSWSTKFKSVYSQLSAEQQAQAQSWYVGSSHLYTPNTFVISDFNKNFASTLRSNSVNPTSRSGFSSSGFSGGGSSGGGGGGGGGGGW
jgi:uncharacterized membrane protein